MNYILFVTYISSEMSRDRKAGNPTSPRHFPLSRPAMASDNFPEAAPRHFPESDGPSVLAEQPRKSPPFQQSHYFSTMTLFFGLLTMVS